MEYSISRYSDYIRRFLQAGSLGVVHSVYRNTVNLSLDDRLFALQGMNSPMSPVSLITALSESEMGSLGIRTGQLVEFTGNCIIINEINLCFSLASGSRISLFLCNAAPGILTSGQTNLLRERICQTLLRSNAGGFCSVFCRLYAIGEYGEESESASPILSAAFDRMETARQLMREQCWDEAAAALVRLIGLGGGLTPSGDDFLCGVMAGLRLCGRIEHDFSRRLIHLLSEHLEDTNDISRTFLCCSLEGYFSQAVVNLRCVPDADEILRSFSAIGHSSGIDSLGGVLYVLEQESFL